MTHSDLIITWCRNPFFVLELGVTATRPEVERAGQRLLGLLRVNAAGAAEYVTPAGSFERDESLVRHAMETLRDPLQRLTAELWATITPMVAPPEESPAVKAAMAKWDGAERALGWARQRL